VSTAVHMRPTTSRNGRAAERGAEVLDAAAVVLARQGYDGTSIDDIADELGATKGRVYHYYRSKADILLGVLDAGIERLTDEVGPAAADTALAADERLHRMAKAHALTMMTHHAYQVVAIRTLDRRIADRWGSRDVAWAAIVERRDAYEHLFIGVLEEGQAEGLFATPDPRLTARALLGALNWVTVWFKPDADPQGRAAPDDIAEDLARFVVAGARDGGPAASR
jgi:AcrR family transcriptional regulator